jgi:cytochrome oxidase assembly protein ShyY1
LVLHVALLVVVGLFALAGFWQLDRLSERRERNELVRERRELPVTNIRDLPDDPDAVAHRRARAEGRYDTGREILLLGRSDRGRPGNHVLTPLVLSGGRAVIVDRGWVPVEFDSAPVVDALPPDGRVEVTGTLQPSEGGGPLASDDEIGEAISRIDVARIGRSLPYRTFPLYLVLQKQEPAQPGELPNPATPPELGEGSHLIYTIQWFLFIAIALVGYGAILRREARKAAKASVPM